MSEDQPNREDVFTYLGIELQPWQRDCILAYFRRNPVPRGADPETCRHNVMAGGLRDLPNGSTQQFLYCVSCGTDLSTKEMRVGKNYEFDVVYNVWVHKPKRPQPPTDPDDYHDIEWGLHGS